MTSTPAVAQRELTTSVMDRVWTAARRAFGMHEPTAAPGAWTVLAFGVPPQDRRLVDALFPEMRKFFVSRNANARQVEKLHRQCGHNVVLCWGPSTPKSLAELSSTHPDLQVAWLYPGPFTIYDEVVYQGYSLDWTGLYVNPRRGCDFEFYANAFPFEANQPLTAASEALRAKLFDIGDREHRNVVAVILQDRTDPAFALAETVALGHIDLIRKAAEDHPDARLAVLLGVRADQQAALAATIRAAAPADLASRLSFAPDEQSGFDILCGCRHVYTVSSPMAAAAVLAGREVTTFSSCFYAGWGLTDDRGAVLRRNRKLNRAEFATLVFALHFRWVSEDGRLLFPGAPIDAPA